MATRSHTRQKSDDSKLAFELEEVQSNLSSENVAFSQPKIRSGFAQWGRRAQDQLFYLGGQIKKVNLTVLSIVLLVKSIVIPASLACVVMFMYRPAVDISLQSFEIPSQNASRNEDAYSVARRGARKFQELLPKNRVRRSAVPFPDPWALPGDPKDKNHNKWYKYTQYRSKWNIDLIYLPQGPDKNMFTVEALRAAHEVEQRIMNYPGFVDFCWKWKMVRLDPILSNKYNACTPPISLIDFFFPTKYLGMTFFDGQGRQNLTEKAMNKTLQFLLSKKFTYWFVDTSFSTDNRRSKFLRAQIKFGYPLKGYQRRGYNHGTPLKEQDEKFNAFMKKFVEFMKTQSNDKVKVLYGGPEVFDYLITTTMWSDVALAKYTLIIIILFVFFLTSFSVFLTFFGIMSILTSLVYAAFIFCVICKIGTVGILSGVSLFIIIGIGVDDVFVFINTFVHAKHAKDIETRLMHTVTTAGGATFFTSFTTAAAFGANCLSKIPAIHDFGLFMMLIVISCWFTVLFTIPPALYLWHQYIHKVEKQCANFVFQFLPFCQGCGAGRSGLPVDIEHFLAGNRHGVQSTTQTESESISQEVDDANPLISDDSNINSEDSSDLLYMSDEGGDGECSVPLLPMLTTTRNPTRRNNHSFLCSLQLWLYYYCKPVTFCRYGLLLLYLGILGGSIYMNTKVKPAKKPPAFFHKDSNLQQLLDLKYNMSSDNYDCKICEDIVEVGSNFINGLPQTTKRTTKWLTTSTTPMKPTAPTTFKPTTLAFVLHTQKKTVRPTTLSTAPPTIRTTTKTTTFKTTSGGTQSLPATKQPATKQPATKQPATHSILTAKVTTIPTTTSGNGIQKKTAITDSGVADKPTTMPFVPSDSPELCADPSMCEPAPKPVLGKTVHVKLVFGIKGIHRPSGARQHVLENKGSVIMDPKFTLLFYEHKSKFISYMCQICNAFSNNKELVADSGSQCFSVGMWDLLDRYGLKECEGVKRSNTDLKGQVEAEIYYRNTEHVIYQNSTKALFLIMTFETKIDKGMSSMNMLTWYYKFDNFLKEQLKKIGDEAIDSAFHTSESWVHMFMEVIAVSGAIYGIVFSLFLCLVAVIIFTGHIMLSIIVILTILGVLCTVVGIFYLAGWQIGAVEAISLSILVGTSVDYCVHLVDGYIISGHYVPSHLNRKKDIRSWRTSAAVSHIGSSILSSAMTTIAASIPLCLTTIQLFAKFGQILAINTTVSIVYTLSFCLAFLTICAPARFKRPFRSIVIAVIVVSIVVGMGVLILYIVSLVIKGTPIPGPDGNPLFKV